MDTIIVLHRAMNIIKKSMKLWTITKGMDT